MRVGCGKLVSPERLIVVMRVDSTAIGRPSLSVCPVVAGLAGRRRLARLWLEGECSSGVAGGAGVLGELRLFVCSCKDGEATIASLLVL